MRRGGLLILLIGLILIVGAGALFFLLQTPSPDVTDAPTQLPTEDPGVNIIIAQVDIPANTVLSNTQSLLSTRNVPSNEYNRNEDITESERAEIENKLLVRAVRGGDAIPRSALIDPGLSQQIPTAAPDRPARDKAYPVQVSNLTGVADQVKVGDFVDVVATFVVQRAVFLPREITTEEDPLNPGQARQVIEREFTSNTPFQTTKTLIQRAQVLRVIRPPVVPEGTPGAAPASDQPAQTDASGRPVDAETSGGVTPEGTLTQGEWVLVLAVNDQEAELLEFARNFTLVEGQEASIALVLRGAGDEDFEPTIGVTVDLLVSEFGLPLPRPLPPRVFSNEESFTADPTPTPGIPGRVPVPTRVP